MPGGKPTMTYAIQCFGEPGAEIINPTPAFPIYESMINYTGATSVKYDLTEDKDLKFSADKILSLVTDKTRLLVLINPNNRFIVDKYLMEKKCLLFLTTQN